MSVREQFRPGKNFTLSDKAAAAKPLTSGDKATDTARVAELAAQISAFQDIWYAAREHKFLVILQGMDTSGKDGTVRGVFGQVDPLGVRSIGFKAPTAFERERDYLWRVHREVPGAGELVIFNRSHYEDVLVPAVRGTLDDAERRRRLHHIADFERLLAETGTVVMKFFLHISKAEQKERLQARLANPDKHWKFDPQDLVERQHWDQYQGLYEEAITATDSEQAPWYVVPADSKTQRNLVIATIVTETLAALNLAYPPPNPEYFKLQVD